jgi:3-oxoacyl-[acyl-carrier-protein] synthase II
MEQSRLVEWLNRCDDNDHVRNRFGVSIGSGMSGVREIVQATGTIVGSGDVSIRKLSPHFIPKVLTNSASGRVSLEHGLRGPNLSPSTACAAGSHAIGDAYRAIQYGTADIFLAGGAEASIEPIGMAGFCRLRALSTGFPPERSSRPFDVQRDGFVMGEGAAVLVLEELDHAKQRNATILAEICGYGLSGDAFHITAPDEEGRGAERAMIMALNDAGYQNENGTMERLTIGYINAHATSTPRGDDVETRVIDRVLRHVSSMANDDTYDLSTSPYVSSTKGATGHLLGAAGALEAAITVMSIVEQRIPPTLNLEQAGVEGDDDGKHSHRFQHVQHMAVTPPTELKAAISNSFGFGGTNSSLIFCKYHDEHS